MAARGAIDSQTASDQDVPAVGKWITDEGSGSLDVAAESGLYSATITVASDEGATADLTGPLSRQRDGTYLLKNEDGTCSASIRFADATTAVVSGDNGGCDGAGTTLNGTYYKGPHAKPSAVARAVDNDAASEPVATESAADEVGPTIKGVRLGQAAASVQASVLKAIEADESSLPEAKRLSHSIQDDSTLRAAAYTGGAMSAEQLDAANAAHQKAIGAFGCDPQPILDRNRDISGGRWMLFGAPDTGRCVVAIHFGSNQTVDWYRIDQDAADLLFGAGRTSVDQFYQALIDNYSIPSLDVSKKPIFSEQNGDLLATDESASYESPDGWRIELAGKTLTVISLAPASKRFN
ncbi:hypothetical protein [Frateuria terrea]|nr:hypothetical protein [Frateuria terrea]